MSEKNLGATDMSPKKQWAGILIHTPTHILLVQHPEIGWTLPGGCIDHETQDANGETESPSESAIRHVYVKTGILLPRVSTRFCRWTTGDVSGWKCCVLQHPIKEMLPNQDGQWWPKDALPLEFTNGRLWRTITMAWRDQYKTVEVIHRNARTLMEG